jgi:hypothetical protein
VFLLRSIEKFPYVVKWSRFLHELEPCIRTRVQLGSSTYFFKKFFLSAFVTKKAPTLKKKSEISLDFCFLFVNSRIAKKRRRVFRTRLKHRGIYRMLRGESQRWWTSPNAAPRWVHS